MSLKYLPFLSSQSRTVFGRYTMITIRNVNDLIFSVKYYISVSRMFDAGFVNSFFKITPILNFWAAEEIGCGDYVSK